jgi:di/tricarboxylate transporter
MTWEIALIFTLLAGTLGLFLWEKFSPDLVALALFCVLAATTLLPAQDAFSVFANTAPFTVGAMFVLSAALVKCGAIDGVSRLVERYGGLPYPVVMLGLVLLVAAMSAFINNTPVVVVFLPVVLNLARKMQLAPSKLLIPLSYAAVLGGTCTLIGTSTNLVVNGAITAKGIQGFSMFELAWLGVPAAVIGALYLAFFGKRLLPDRAMLSSILSEDERREYITEAFVQPAAAAVGKTLAEAGLGSKRGIRVLEIVRDGVALPFDPKITRLNAGDRLVLACRPQGIAAARGVAGIDLVSELALGLEQIAAHEGSLVEAVVNPNSDPVGQSVKDLNFRQRYRMVVLALHRQGRNVREKVDSLPLAAGDVLLMMGTDQAIDALQNSSDLVVFDRARTPARPKTRYIPLVLGVIAAVVLAEVVGLVPIHLGALIGCVVVCAAGCLSTKEAYDSIEWPVLFLIYAMLAAGLALDRTGAASWLARGIITLVEPLASEAMRPLVVLGAIYLVTTVLTEILSNNAVAALMIPIVLGVAAELGVDPRPFIIAATFAASAAFATPIGYQTNTYVYGVGGYKFGDFVKIGVPLNLVCMTVALIVIPIIWPFTKLAAE